MSTFQTISESCRKVLPKGEVHDINMESNFISDLRFDSITFVALVFELENQFKLSLVNHVDDMIKLKTVKDAVLFMENVHALQQQ